MTSSPTQAPFLCYGYLQRWWLYRGGGEWPESSLVLLGAREQGRLVGIAPFFKTRHAGQEKLLLLGSIEISDYLDFIYLPEKGAIFFEALFKYLGQEPELKDLPLLLFNLPESSPSHALLNQAAAMHGWQLQTERAYHTPAIPLAADWDTYLAGIDKKQRHEIRRKLRRAEEGGEDIRWYILNQEHDLDAEIEDFLLLMAHDEQKQGFLTETMRAQLRSIMRWAHDEKILQLSFLTVTGKKAAAYCCFVYQGRVWVYNSGFDPQFRENSPGWVLLSYLIQHAIQTGQKTFDFMRGDEDYKYRFGAQDSFVLKVEITRE